MPIAYLILFVSTFFLFNIFFHETKFSIFTVCINVLFQLVLIRDVVVSIFSIAFKTSVYDIVAQRELYMLSFAITRILILILILNFDKICEKTKAKKLLKNISVLKQMLLIKGALLIMMLNSNYTYYYSGNTKQVALILLINRIIIYGCFYFIIGMEIKQLSWKDAEINHEITAMQLEYQKDNYLKRERYSKILQMYNHDFKSILNNVNKLIENNKINEARDILSNIDSEINIIIEENKKYSNRLIVDIILNELAEKCRESNIKFLAECYIPENLNLKDLEISRIFSNIANNAYEACMKQTSSEYKEINFKSYIKDENLVILEQNTFNGVLIVEKNKLRTTKKNSEHHGIGIESIKNIVEYFGGIVLIKFNEEKKEFKIIIKIPIDII